MLKINNFPKKILKISILIFTVMISSFIFNNKINAEETVIWEGRPDGILQGGFTSEYLKTIIEYNNLDVSIYDSFALYDNSGRFGELYRTQFGIYFFNSEDYKNGYIEIYNASVGGFAYWESSKGFYHLDIYDKIKSDYYSMMKFEWFNYEQNLSFNSHYSASYGINPNPFVVIGKISDYVVLEPTSFDITIIDSDLGYIYGTNYLKGQQNNTIDFYINDSGILLDSHSKGYIIDKIYYDDKLTQEALLTDVVEKDTTLYVTWKSKIDISYRIATDLSNNDVITLFFDFSKIYNENYSYWVSVDGTNYTDITNSLNSNYSYNTSVYFHNIYYARVQDENNITISVNYIDVDYYRISPETSFGNDIDDDGKLKPYIILDYSSYSEIKDKLIFEYSINNGETWIDVSNDLDENFKYKLYINIGDKVITRVRTIEDVIFPNTGYGSSYDITEEFYNSIINTTQYNGFVDSLKHFTEPIRFIFSSITNFYNNYCPDVFQSFVYISFIFLVSIVLIRLFL